MSEATNTTITHVYPEPDRVRLKVEKNSKGFNWEVSVSGGTLEEAKTLLDAATAKMKAEYGDVTAA